MEKFKEKIRVRIISLSLITSLVCLINVILLTNRSRLPEISDFILGFQSGVFIGLILILVFCLMKFLASMKSDEALKKLYIQENDERRQLIGYKTSVFTTVGMLILLAFATVVAGFFNEIVFFTLLGVLAALLILLYATLIYFKKTI
ncbi:hypothetical protein [Paenibacillus segetis]|uniref:DUF2178 domain-containing protein n=1 Tax=Paenibacillus segetis TaxID=1325360 RepID=A0ABQ1Y805_9BACL|nr:hypothetical protein [Paenibacillus segetis]GGH15321.1 hypothetical protein GCM10008013_09450 [Paenibacillus segetis]